MMQKVLKQIKRGIEGCCILITGLALIYIGSRALIGAHGMGKLWDEYAEICFWSYGTSSSMSFPLITNFFVPVSEIVRSIFQDVISLPVVIPGAEAKS
jgi:hypothetical protein